MNIYSPEILINSSQVLPQAFGDVYEFVLNEKLELIDCVQIASVAQGVVLPIINPSEVLEGMLFQFNHVRVNPRVDNTLIVDILTARLSEVGVRVKGQAVVNKSAISFKSIGEISDDVRFYIKPQSAEVVFLSPANRLKLIRHKI